MKSMMMPALMHVLLLLAVSVGGKTLTNLRSTSRSSFSAGKNLRTTSKARSSPANANRIHNILQLGQPPVHRRRHRHRYLQGEAGDAPPSNCTDTVPELFLEESLKTGSCIADWPTKSWQFYPYDFQGLTNQVQRYVCPDSKKRIIASNGIPDHAVRIESPNLPCEKFWYVELPLEPEYISTDDGLAEPSPAGIVAMALNGVPIFGAQEVFGGNAVEPDLNSNTSVMDARFWYGHATGLNIQHYHNPDAGRVSPTDATILGFALDGFPVYGPIDDDSILDECNGVFVDGSYRYHVRSLDQVNDTLPYCAADGSPAIQWPYIVGCFHGNLSNTRFRAFDSLDNLTIPTDCVPDDLTPDDDDAQGNNITTDPRPNIIIMQPDDLPFFQEWTPPPNNPASPNRTTPFPNDFTMPNVERLRRQGLQMMQAYTTSPACGTSRYSTITGKYPSRSSASREKAAAAGRNAAKVTIPRTKLVDLENYTNDCTEENLVPVFRANGYRTGVVGKWHLSLAEEGTYSYSGYREDVKNCGFDFAEALYAENLDDETIHGVTNLTLEGQQFSHNMEWVTSEAINFINGDYEGADDSEPFLLYFNPTVPHSSGNVTEALTDDRFVCTVTADVGNPLPSDPLIKGMTLEYGGCVPYRDTVGVRAGGIRNSNENLGAVWVDDSVGALIHALIDKGVFENTIILFQIDHGIEAKQTLYENGNRIVQFIHYPNGFGTEGKTFEGLVSTIDIAPTMFDFAGIESYYDLDGTSWKDAIDDPAQEEDWKNDRCLLFENQFDRAVRCGCGKLMTLQGENSTNDVSTTLTQGELFGFNTDYVQFMDLCDQDTGNYVSFPEANPEVNNFYDPNSNVVQTMYRSVLRCFRNATDPAETPDFQANCSALFDSNVVSARTCYSDLDCANNTKNKFCDETVRTCVQCKLDGHCGGNALNIFCHDDNLKCISCKNDEHCEEDERCTLAGKCVLSGGS